MLTKVIITKVIIALSLSFSDNTRTKNVLANLGSLRIKEPLVQQLTPCVSCYTCWHIFNRYNHAYEHNTHSCQCMLIAVIIIYNHTVTKLYDRAIALFFALFFSTLTFVSVTLWSRLLRYFLLHDNSIENERTLFYFEVHFL